MQPGELFGQREFHKPLNAAERGKAREVGAALPVSALAAALEDGIVACGHGDDDIAALARPIRQLSGIEG